MKYLTYHPNRRRQWTEHNRFPKGAIKWWRESSHGQRYPAPIMVFSLSEDRQTVTFIPEEEWEL